MIVKKLALTLFILFFISIIGWLFLEASKPDVLPIGSHIPEIEFKTQTGSVHLQPDYTHNIMVVSFHQQCEHCVYQLSQLNRNITKFQNLKIVLLTFEQHYFKTNDIYNYNLLAVSENVSWGVIDKSQFKKYFGRLVIPSIFIFDSSGMLYKKIHGEIKIESLLKSIKNLSGPER